MEKSWTSNDLNAEKKKNILSENNLVSGIITYNMTKTNFSNYNKDFEAFSEPINDNPKNRWFPFTSINGIHNEEKGVIDLDEDMREQHITDYINNLDKISFKTEFVNQNRDFNYPVRKDWLKNDDKDQSISLRQLAYNI